MPRITVLTSARGLIPAQKVNALGMPKTTVFSLISGTAYWGFNSDVDDTGASTAGIPLTIGAPVAIAADDGRLADAIYFYATADAVIAYQQQMK